MPGSLINRRQFIKNTTLAAGAIAVSSPSFLGNASIVKSQNPLPQWKGFNLLDFFSPEPWDGSEKTTENDLKWMADWGFNFVRIPMSYPRYLNINKKEKIRPDQVTKFDNEVLEEIDNLVDKAINAGLHVSLNLHRAPGYCINAGFYEPFNLWKDKSAQEAFNAHWSMWANRYKSYSREKLSFDLLNEPAYKEDLNDQFSKSSQLPGELYRKIAEGAVNEIRKANPDRPIIADGNNVGSAVTPELIDLNLAQSCRGYFPHYISHYQAPWVWKDPSKAPEAVWPGTMDGKYFSKQNLEDFYKPWLELADKGVGVHCGECGCWRNTPHHVFLSWFGDILEILNRGKIGFALWNFRGDFGILDSGRKDVQYEDWNGHKLDRKLLELCLKTRF
ncbi:MAG: cellulase family glycosylhydrolase [Bacteroidales bacterium]